jgi:hypothetical protein
MRDRLKLPRAFIALILAGSAENCLRKAPRAAKIRRVEWRSH